MFLGTCLVLRLCPPLLGLQSSAPNAYVTTEADQSSAGVTWQRPPFLSLDCLGVDRQQTVLHLGNAICWRDDVVQTCVENICWKCWEIPLACSAGDPRHLQTARKCYPARS